MNENIDLTKILKDCPKGTKFYSCIYGEETYFQGISLYKGNPVPIHICGEFGEDKSFYLSRKGHPIADRLGECVIFPSKDQRDWSKFKAPWYKKSKFDPRTLNPFHKVLIWKELDCTWMPTLFTFLDFSLKYPRMRYDSFAVKVIPYNDDTKHLLGKSVEAPEYYRYWED